MRRSRRIFFVVCCYAAGRLSKYHFRQVETGIRPQNPAFVAKITTGRPFHELSATNQMILLVYF
jgi:hypothetical protein